MRKSLVALATALMLAAPAPALAENPFGFDPEKLLDLQRRLEEESKKLEDAAREAAKGFSEKLAEDIEGPLAGLMQALGETLPGLLEELEGFDMPAYEAPVILPNGDILIRRKPDSPYKGPPKEGEVDL